MNFEFPESTALIAETVRDVMRTSWSVEALRETMNGDVEALDRLWRTITELGWTGILIDESAGGASGSVLDAIVLAEGLGRACCPVAFVESAMVVPSIVSDAATLSSIASGTNICLGLVDAEGFADPLGSDFSLTGETLNGTKTLIKRPSDCEQLLVIGRDTQGPGGALVQAQQSGVSWRTHSTLAGFTYDAMLSDVTEFEPLAASASTIDRAFAIGMLGHVAHMVGAASYVLDLAIEYAKVREQSGQPIGAHQAIQHRLADMAYGVDGARYMLYRSANDATGRDPNPTLHHAKAFATRACLEVVRGAHQVFGAIGFCEEHDLHLYHKHVLASSVAFGDGMYHLDQVAERLGLETSQA
ncbi:MAG: acyl-CoA dehydrogenase family protein [Pseudomonadota bacterium]